MKKLLLILFVLWSCFCFSQKKHNDGPFKNYYKNGQLKQEGYYRNNKKIGVWNDYYDTGEILRTYSYSGNGSGKKTGF